MRKVLSLVAVIGCLSSLSMRAHAQESAGSTPAIPATLGTTVLERMISIQFQEVPLRAALAAIAEQGDVRLTYSNETLPLDRKVSLVATHMTVGDALRAVTQGLGIVISTTSNGRVMLERVDERAGGALTALQQGTAMLSGSTTDSGTGATIPQVTVHIDGTSLSVKSSADGQYKFTNIAAGEYRVTARRVGYLAKTRTITLADGDNKKLDFGLNPPATQLNEVVTTALGEQRRYEVGNVIATINVDSIAPTAPVTNVTDILSGRVPGVEVLETSGMVGGGEFIRIRGQASLLLEADPIIIVDGIRVDNSPGGTGNGSSIGRGQPSPSRINDLDFSQIETINILKGPAATTEYGTDAANGVIVITTKHGTSGPPQWNASADQATSEVPQGFSDIYTSWGHFTNGSGNSTYCDLTNTYFGQVGASTTGDCVVDSLTAFNPLNVPSYSMYDNGPSSTYHLNVGGGSDQIRYMILGGFSQATGTLHLPEVFHEEAISAGFPSSVFDPNTQNQRSLRANTSIKMNSATDVQMSVAYMSTDQEGPMASNLFDGLGLGPSLPDSAHNYGYGFNAAFGAPTGTCSGSCTTSIGSPLAEAGNLDDFLTQRWTGTLAATWRPTGWLSVVADAGVDHGNFTDQNIDLPQAAYFDGAGSLSAGSVEEDIGSNDIYTVDLRGSTTATLFHHIRAMTSFGANYVDTRYNGLTSSENNLTTAPLTITGSANVSTNQSQSEAITAGAYVEEEFGFGDRCYVPLALRLDTGSGFGVAAGGTSGNYPKWGLTCMVLTGRTTLRLRAAYGEAGQQPPYGAALPTYSTGAQTLGAAGQYISGYQLLTAGNDMLKPQRSAQTEAGVDLGLWNSRVNVEGSWYSTYTTNMLYEQSLDWELGYWGYTENIGNVRNLGWEGTVSAVVVQARAMAWSVHLNTSFNTNKLLRLASGILNTNVGNAEYFAVGYPLFGNWGYVDRYADLTHDGIITPRDVTESDTLVYVGSSDPRQETSISSDMRCFHGTVGVQALFDMRGDVKIFDHGSQGATGFPFYAGENVPSTSQFMQAQQIEFDQYSGQGTLTFFNGAYVRFRELSVSVYAPRRWLHATRLNALTLVGGIRNLALWTRYPLGDPEVSGTGHPSYNPASETSSPQNDLRYASLTAVPLPRLFDLTLNVGF